MIWSLSLCPAFRRWWRPPVEPMCRQGISGQRWPPMLWLAKARPRYPSLTLRGCCWRRRRRRRRRLLVALNLHASMRPARSGASSSKSGVVSALQLINHGVPDDVIQGMKANIEAFFGLPAETKQQFAQERGQLEGYGQLFVVSEDQKLDWADILYLNTQPPEHRNTRFWPDKPDTLRSTLDAYSAAVKTVADRLLAIMSSNLGLPPEVVASRCSGGGMQSVRINYYPPCAEADKVVGFSPHSDADLLTLVLQVNQVQGLQVKRQDGTWVPVRPLDGAFVVNVGDILQGDDEGFEKLLKEISVQARATPYCARCVVHCVVEDGRRLKKKLTCGGHMSARRERERNNRGVLVHTEDMYAYSSLTVSLDIQT
ncbi:hypothetical protein PVAP13_9KG246200 [Panicum virgatum]|uniref:Fe2OG dioxygenase domain-containing protein n=1 Tax=Panicum virgatum TaxID=38727 RepID=A0A8T0P3Z4_PANVG|nr:hypothetical protein PVAP13_9KG246200 [Panicum virgatum]